MKPLRPLLSALLLATAALLSACAHGAKTAVEPGYVSLFNGQDLTGWGYPNGAKFDGLTEVPGDDRRFKVVNGLLTAIARVPPQRPLELRTTANYSR